MRRPLPVSCATIASILAIFGLMAFFPSQSVQAQGTCPIDESRVQNIVPLVNAVPQEGTVRSTVGDFGSLDLTQYTFEVPDSPELAAGKAHLVIDLRNKTDRSFDIDLLVRIGEPVDVFVDSSGDCRVHADYLSRGSGGNEEIVIDSSSDTPLQVTTYYIAVLNFEFDHPGPQDYELVANLTPPPPPPCPDCPVLEPNHAQAAEIAGGPLVDINKQYLVNVPTGAGFLGLLLQGGGNAELNLYVRVGQPVATNGDQIVSDFTLIAPGSAESLVLAGNQLKPGRTYFLAVENRQTQSQKFTLTAALAPTVRSLTEVDLGAAFSGETGLPTLNADLTHLLDQQTRTRDGRLGLTQYRLVVPQGAKALQVQLVGANGAKVRLHLALGAPVSVAQGQVHSDIVMGEATIGQTLTLTGKILQPAVYYLAIESLGSEPARYSLQVTLDTGQPQPPTVSTALVHGRK